MRVRLLVGPDRSAGAGDQLGAGHPRPGDRQDSDHGFKEGDKIDLYEVVEIKDDKGAVVFAEEKLVGELTLISVQPERSRASHSGDLAIQAGWAVKAK